MKSSLILRSLTLSIFLSTASVYASGYSDPVTIGPRAMGLGGAFVGIASDATAVYHNPAAIVNHPGTDLTLGFDANFTDFQFTPPGGKKERADHKFIPAPFGFITQQLDDNFSLGLGVYFPHGTEIQYDKPSANVLNPQDVSFYTMEITPVIAVKVPAIKGLSLGMGFRIVRITSRIENQGFVLSQSPLIIDELEYVDVNAWTFGAVFSGMYKPVDYFSLGVVYHSPLEAQMSGDGKFTGLGKFTGNISQTIPGLLTVGVGIYPVKKLTVGLQYDYEQNAQNQQTTLALSVFPGTAVAPLDWKNSHTVHVGVGYDWTDSFYTNVGYARDLNKTIQGPSSDRSNTDFDAHFISAGLGYKYKKFEINGAWKTFFGNNTVANNGKNPVPGAYKIFANTMSTSVGYKF